MTIRDDLVNAIIASATPLDQTSIMSKAELTKFLEQEALLLALDKVDALESELVVSKKSLSDSWELLTQQAKQLEAAEKRTGG